MSNYQPFSEGLLAPLKKWFESPNVNEIMLNQPGQIYVEENGQISQYNVPEFDEARLYRLFQLLAKENNQVLDAKHPLLSGNLQDNSRIQIVLPPVAKYPLFAIRRKVQKKVSLGQYNEQKYFLQTQAFSFSNTVLNADDEKLLILYQNNKWHEFINKAILAKKNIIISGGTSSGKTTFLNACLQEIPSQDRIIILEDTREVEISHPNQVQLLASKGEQGLAPISMQELVQCCLRLRPDRIIMGEIRGKEILDFISACSTGHEGGLTTIHANNPQIAFMRMTQMYKLNNVPAMTDNDILRELKSVVDIIIQVEKTSMGRMAKSIYYKGAMNNNEFLE